jgi:hypothetical protein
LVLDSIETLLAQDHDKIALLYKEAAEQAIGNKNIVAVGVSNASNNGTKALRKLASKESIKPNYKFPENDLHNGDWYNGDCSKAYVLAKA